MLPNTIIVAKINSPPKMAICKLGWIGRSKRTAGGIQAHRRRNQRKHKKNHLRVREIHDNATHVKATRRRNAANRITRLYWILRLRYTSLRMTRVNMHNAGFHPETLVREIKQIRRTKALDDKKRRRASRNKNAVGLAAINAETPATSRHVCIAIPVQSPRIMQKPRRAP